MEYGFEVVSECKVGKFHTHSCPLVHMSPARTFLAYIWLVLPQPEPALQWPQVWLAWMGPVKDSITMVWMMVTSTNFVVGPSIPSTNSSNHDSRHSSRGTIGKNVLDPGHNRKVGNHMGSPFFL